MAYSSITITFNQSLPAGSNLYISTGAIIGISLKWVALSPVTNEVLVASPTANVGETEAINFVAAFNSGINAILGYAVVRSVNIVTITSTSYNVFSNASVTNSIWNEYIGWVVPDGETLTFYDVVFVIDNQTAPSDTDIVDPEIFHLPEVKSINIDIIDTQDNDRNMLLELTEMKSPKLKWNGSDDLFQNIMTSDLRFNILVDDAQDAKFLHLFTSDENRYKVIVNEVSDDLNPIMLWQGHLLPEQFSEPYERAQFFVEFIATDGIGLLKNKYLDNLYYAKKLPISFIIAKCLELTGNLFDIWFSPAYKNAILEDLNIQDLAINTFMYDAGNKKQSAYKILESLLKFLGVKLLQLNKKWFIIGLNRFNDVELVCSVFNPFGNFVKKQTFKRIVKKNKFLSYPEIGLLPALNKVVCNYDVEASNDLFPGYFSKQKLQSAVTSSGLLSVNYFKIIGKTSDFNFGLISTVELEKYLSYSGFAWDGEPCDVDGYKEFLHYRGAKPEPLLLAVKGGHSDTSNHYIELQSEVYVEPDLWSKRSVDLDVSVFTVAGTNSGSITDAEFNNTFVYELFFNDVLVASNNGNGSNYVLDRGSFGVVRASASKKDIEILSSGYFKLKIKTKPTLSGYNLVYSYYTDVSLKGTNFSVPLDFVKVRDNKSSLIENISLNNVDSRISLFKENLEFRENYQLPNVDKSYPAIFKKLEVSNYVSNPSTMWCSYDINVDDYLLLRDNIGYLNKKVNGQGSLVQDDYITGVFVNQNGFIMKYVVIGAAPTDTETVYRFNDGDEIWINRPARTELIADKRFLLDKWSSFYKNDEKHIGEVIAEMYHDLLSVAKLNIEGEYLNLVFPLDIILFDYQNEKRLLPVKTSLDLSTGVSNVFLIEDFVADVDDYVIDYLSE